MLAIRFNRVGKKNKAQFRIVVQEHTIAPGGRHVEIVGSYDPHSKKGVFKNERIKHWIDKGAQVSDSVYNLFIKQGIVTGEKRLIKIKAKKQKKGEEEAPNQSAKADAASLDEREPRRTGQAKEPVAEKKEEKQDKKEEDKPAEKPKK